MKKNKKRRSLNTNPGWIPKSKRKTQSRLEAIKDVKTKEAEGVFDLIKTKEFQSITQLHYYQDFIGRDLSQESLDLQMQWTRLSINSNFGPIIE